MGPAVESASVAMIRKHWQTYEVESSIGMSNQILKRAQTRRLQRQLPSGCCPPRVLPIVPRIGCCAGKCPKPKALRIDLGEIGNAANQLNRVTMKARFAIHQVLNRGVCAIADEWLWVNQQPRLSLRPQNVAGMKIRDQKHIGSRGFGEFLKDPQ